MSSLNDDIMRGCLENGEPIEAKWGMGWWSGWDEKDDYEIGQCPVCNGSAYYGRGEFLQCENGCKPEVIE